MIHTERGWVLTWAIFLILPLLTVGLTFLYYGKLSRDKLYAQFLSMNTVTIGGFSSEFDSNESLNAMAMYASSAGYGSVSPVETGQSFSAADVVIDHDTSVVGDPKLAAYLRIHNSPVSNLVASLGDVEVSGFSRSSPKKLFMSIAIDLSLSLIGDADISDLLTVFGVLGAGPHGEGVNGVWDATRGQVVPTDAIRNIIPFGIDQWLREQFPWDTASVALPIVTTPADPACVASSEIPCGTGGAASQLAALNTTMTNQIMAYKKAAAILVGVAAQMTPYLDVNILSSPYGPYISDLVTNLTQGTPYDPSANFEIFENNGLYPLWRYDERDVNNFSLNASGNPVWTASIVKQYSYREPKNPFKDSIVLTPTRPYIFFLNMAYYRKAIEYFSFTDADGNALNVDMDGLRSFMRPPLPTINNPDFNPPPTDSFVHNPGPLVGDKKLLQNEMFYNYGWPTNPMFLATSGDAHASQATLPEPISSVYEYNCATGPARSNNYPFSQTRADPGWWLCQTYDYCDDQTMNDSPHCESGTIDPAIVNRYYDNTQTKSPYCPPGFDPRCLVNGAATPSTEDGVQCVHGVTRCFGNFLATPICYNLSTGAVNALGPKCVPSTDNAAVTAYPGENVNQPYGQGPGTTVTPVPVPPLYRGAITPPAGQPPQINRHTLWHAINDLVPIPGGTHTHQAPPNERCSQFKESTAGLGDCAMVLITDGRPVGTDVSGAPSLDDEAVMTALTTNMSTFTDTWNGKSFTWFLGKSDGFLKLQAYLAGVSDAGTMSEDQTTVYKDYVLGEINLTDPSKDCTTYASIPGAGSCSSFNTLLNNHKADTTILEEFKDLMDAPPQRIYTETAIRNTSQGASFASSENEFLKGLRYLLALLKREVSYDK